MSVKSRYIFSVMFDMICLQVIAFFGYISNFDNYSYAYRISAFFAIFLIYLLGDFLFANRSLGKVIFRIKAVAPDGLSKALFLHKIIRRIIEIYFMFYLIFKTQIDGLGILAKTRIVSTITKDES